MSFLGGSKATDKKNGEKLEGKVARKGRYLLLGNWPNNGYNSRCDGHCHGHCDSGTHRFTQSDMILCMNQRASGSCCGRDCRRRDRCGRRNRRWCGSNCFGYRGYRAYRFVRTAHMTACVPTYLHAYLCIWKHASNGCTSRLDVPTHGVYII